MDKNITLPQKPPQNSAQYQPLPAQMEKYESVLLSQVPLTSLTGSGIVCGVSPSLEQRTANRLEDLGFTPGEKVRHMMKSPLGGGAAYIIKGSIIVLRHTTAAKIKIIPVQSPDEPEKADEE